AEARATGDPLHSRSHPVHGADRRRGHPAAARADPRPALPHVALSPAGNRRAGAVVVRRDLAAKRIESGRPVRDGGGDIVLHRARLAGAPARCYPANQYSMSRFLSIPVLLIPLSVGAAIRLDAPRSFRTNAEATRTAIADF